MSIEHADTTSIHRFAFVSNSDPGAVGAFKAWVDTSVSPYALKIRNSGNTGWNDIASATDAVTITGTQTVTGAKTFSSIVTLALGLTATAAPAVSPGVDIPITASDATRGIGGAVILTGGDAASLVGGNQGGAVRLTGGRGATNGGLGGDIKLTGGQARSGNTDGGGIYLKGGVASGSGKSGKVYIQDPDSGFSAVLNPDGITGANKSFAFPNRTGTFALTDDIGIGATLLSGTPGSVLFVGGSVTLNQDNTHFFYDSTLAQLKLLDASYSVVGGSRAYLSIGSTTPISNITTNQYGMVIDITRTAASGSAFSTVGLRTLVTKQGAASTHNVYGAYHTAQNNGDTDNATGIYGLAAFANAFVAGGNPVVGGSFNTQAVSTGGGGTGNISNLRGIEAIASSNTGRLITVSEAIKAIVNTFGTGTTSTAIGLSVSDWTISGTSTVTNAYGVYIDTTFDGAVNPYAIYSLSVSPSLFSGSVYGPINAYDATTWNNSAKFATEGAVRNKIETILLADDTGLLFTEVVLNNADILALPTSSQDIVPAPGSGKILEVDKVVLIRSWVAGYTNVSHVEGFLQLGYAGVGNPSGLLVTDSSNTITHLQHFLEDAFTNPDVRLARWSAYYYIDATGNYDIMEGGGSQVFPDQANAPLTLSLSNGVANADGNLTGGDAGNTLKIKIWYRVITI